MYPFTQEMVSFVAYSAANHFFLQANIGRDSICVWHSCHPSSRSCNHWGCFVASILGIVALHGWWVSPKPCSEGIPGLDVLEPLWMFFILFLILGFLHCFVHHPCFLLFCCSSPSQDGGAELIVVLVPLGIVHPLSLEMRTCHPWLSGRSPPFWMACTSLTFSPPRLT